MADPGEVRPGDQRTMLAMLAATAECAAFRHGANVEERLHDHARNPARRVPVEVGLEAWQRLPELTGRETIGLSLASEAGIAAFHHLGVAFASAPHLLGALQIFARHFPHLCQTEHVFEYSLDGQTVIGWDEAADVAPHTLRDYLFAELVRALRRYGWRAVAPLRIELNAPRDLAAAYQEAFGCPVHMNAPRSRIVLETASLATPLRGSNPDLHQQITMRLAADEDTARSIARRVVGALDQLLDRREPRIEAVARHLGVSVRSLQHHLTAEGYRYSDLLKRVRQRRALHLLCETSIPIRSIAYQLGYENSGSFQRAFRRWFGLQPAHFRRQHCGR